jgi:hypothetical protein
MFDRLAGFQTTPIHGTAETAVDLMFSYIKIKL